MTHPAIEVGAAVHQARRERNEDQAASGVFPEGAYLIVADGVGGEAWGQLASNTACRWAEGSIMKKLQAALDAGVEPDLHHVVRLAFRGATHGLRRAASVGGHRFGLKTTLIVAIVWKDQLVVAHVGDGGLWAWDESMLSPCALIQPMANEAGELAAVLSPWCRAEPRIAMHPWRPGRVLIAATDGVADPIPVAGVACLAKALNDSTAPIQHLLQQLLEACYGQFDELGPIFTDNMGVAALRHRGG